MNLLPLIIDLISGAVGGNVAGSLLKQYDLGTLGNSIAGIVGGGIGGQILSALIPALANSGGDGGAIGSILSQVAGGGVGGAILMVIIGLVRQAMGGAPATK